MRRFPENLFNPNIFHHFTVVVLHASILTLFLESFFSRNNSYLPLAADVSSQFETPSKEELSLPLHLLAASTPRDAPLSGVDRRRYAPDDLDPSFQLGRFKSL